MMKVNVVGKFLGDEKNKSYPDKTYLIVRPEVPAPDGMLKPVRVVPPESRGFGAADVLRELGTVAVMCDLGRLPDIGIGERVSLTAVYWPVLRPRWSGWLGEVVDASESDGVFVLDGEVKAADGAARPFGFELKGALTSRRLDEGSEWARMGCEVERGEVPGWLLRKVKVRQNGFKKVVPAEEKLGTIEILADVGQMNRIRRGGLFEARGECWPIRVPYWSERTGKAELSVIPEMEFRALEVSALSGNPDVVTVPGEPAKPEDASLPGMSGGPEVAATSAEGRKGRRV